MVPGGGVSCREWGWGYRGGRKSGVDAGRRGPRGRCRSGQGRGTNGRDGPVFVERAPEALSEKVADSDGEAGQQGGRFEQVFGFKYPRVFGWLKDVDSLVVGIQNPD